MKVLFVTPYSVACGIATYSKNLIDELEKQQVHVEVFSDTTNFNALSRLARESDHDLIHIQHEFGISMTMEPLLSVISKFRSAGKAVVMTMHTEDKAAGILLDGALNAIILHNDGNLMHTKNTFSKFYRIPHGLPELRVTYSRKAEARKKYGIPLDAFVIGTCGFMSNDRAKFLEALFVQLKEYLGSHKQIYIHLANSAHRTDIDGAFAHVVQGSLTKLANEHGYGDRFQMTASFMDNTEFRERLMTMDLGVAYAPAGATSNSGAAADLVSCGVPVVVNRTAHFSHIAPCTLQVDGGVPEIAQGLIQVVENPDLHTELVNKTTEVVQTLGYSKMAERHVQVYQEALDGRNRQLQVMPAPHATLVGKDRPIIIRLPSQLWQAILLWPKLRQLTDDGYRLKFVAQNDGPTEMQLLRHMLPNTERTEFQDLGMTQDSRSVRVHSKYLSHTLSTDIEAWLKAGRPFNQLFSFLSTPDQERIKESMVRLDLGHAAAHTLQELGDLSKTMVIAACPETDDFYCLGFKTNQEEIDRVLVIGTPTSNLHLEQFRKWAKSHEQERTLAMNLTQRMEVKVADVRTCMAVVAKAHHAIVGWDAIGIYAMLIRDGREQPTTLAVDSRWKMQAAPGLFGDNNVTIIPVGKLSNLIKKG